MPDDQMEMTKKEEQRERKEGIFRARWRDKSLRAEWDKVSGECDANEDKKKIYEMAFKLFLYIWLN